MYQIVDATPIQIYKIINWVIRMQSSIVRNIPQLVPITVAGTTFLKEYRLQPWLQNPTLAVREASVSRNNEGKIKGTPLYDSAVMYKGGHNWSPMMPRGDSLSDNYTSDRCCFPNLAFNFPRQCSLSELFSVMKRVLFYKL